MNTALTLVLPAVPGCTGVSELHYATKADAARALFHVLTPAERRAIVAGLCEQCYQERDWCMCRGEGRGNDGARCALYAI